MHYNLFYEKLYILCARNRIYITNKTLRGKRLTLASGAALGTQPVRQGTWSYTWGVRTGGARPLRGGKGSVHFTTTRQAQQC